MSRTYLIVTVLCCLLAVGCQNTATPRSTSTPSGQSAMRRSSGPLVAEFIQFEGTAPTLLHLASDGGDSAIVTAIIPRQRHEEVFSTSPPTHLTLNGIDYVPERSFFNSKFPPKMTIDEGAREYRFAVVNESQARCSDRGIVQALHNGESAQFVFASSMRGKGQVVVFDLSDFEPQAGVQNSPQHRHETADSDAACIRAVAEGMTVPNQFGKTHSDLRVRANARGRGKFVYVPAFKIAGHERWLLWFVLDGQAFALNGPAITVSPSLPRPLDRPLADWDSTGSDAVSIGQVGVSLIFSSGR